MGNIRCGFCAQTHTQRYRCANCGYEEEFSQITNFYERKIVEWPDKVCESCGFKSLKPMTFLEMLSEEQLERLKDIAKDLKNGL